MINRKEKFEKINIELENLYNEFIEFSKREQLDILKDPQLAWEIDKTLKLIKNIQDIMYVSK